MSNTQAVVQGFSKAELRALQEVLAARPFVVAAYLFGSCARGRAWAESDLDVALLLADDAPHGLALGNELARLAADIQRVKPAPPVDLTPLNQQGIAFQHTVLREGVLLYERDRPACRRFAWRVIREYCDFEPTLTLMKRYHLLGRLRRCRRGETRGRADEAGPCPREPRQAAVPGQPEP